MRQGAEKMREMEEILAGAGQFSEQFDLTLGDVMIEDADGDGPPENPDDIPKPPVPKRKPSAFPSIDGEETVDEFVNRYKKALLNKRSQFRTIHEQWQSNPPKTGQCLVLHTSYCFFFRGIDHFWASSIQSFPQRLFWLHLFKPSCQG